MLALPIHDLPTRSASGVLIRYVLPRSLPPQLLGPSDRRGLFSMLAIGDTLIAVGHGAPNLLCGHRDEVIMTTLSIPDVKGKVVILVSCETAQELGPALINAGAVSYIGFKQDLVWVCDADRTSKPWNDELARPVMGPITDCTNTILDGKRVQEAFDTLIAGLSENAELEEDELIKDCILFNKTNAVLLGSPEARVGGRPRVILPIGPPPLPPLIFS